MRLTFVKKKYLLIFILSFFSIILLTLLFLEQQKKITVDFVRPSPNSKTANFSFPIVVYFKNDLRLEQQKKITVSLSPKTEISKQWLNNKTLVLTPQPAFNKNAIYKISLNYKKKLIFEWQFTTPNPKEVVLKEKKKGVLFDSAGKDLEEAYKQNPLLLYLPIREKNYSIDYLESKQKIRILMKINIVSPIPREEQISQIKTEASQKLKEIGVDLNKQQFYYTFIP